MRMKKGLLLVVFLLAISSVMAAMSYNKATVTSAAELKVVNTNQALLSLTADAPWSWENTIGSKDNTSVMKNGELFFQFGKGVERDGTTPAFHGLQANSVYEWNHVFTLSNKSAETVKVTVKATGALADYITFAEGYNPRANQSPTGFGKELVFGKITKESGYGMQNMRSVAVKIEIPAGHGVSLQDIIGSIVVESEAIAD